MKMLALILASLVVFAPVAEAKEKSKSSFHYVKPRVTKKGKLVGGHYAHNPSSGRTRSSHRS
jgi:hypothetical protein